MIIKKAGLYIREMDKKVHKLLGYTDSKNAPRKGKSHVAKVVVENDFVNLFKSSTGYYLMTLEGDMIHTRVAVMSVVKAEKEIFFTVPLEDFDKDYRKKETA